MCIFFEICMCVGLVARCCLKYCCNRRLEERNSGIAFNTESCSKWSLDPYHDPFSWKRNSGQTGIHVGMCTRGGRPTSWGENPFIKKNCLLRLKKCTGGSGVHLCLICRLKAGAVGATSLGRSKLFAFSSIVVR